MPEAHLESSVAVHPQDAATRIRATVRVLIAARKRREALAVLGSIVEQIRHTEGCTGCRLYRDVQEVGALLIEESWSDPKALYRHLRSDAFHHILLVVEMAAEAPEIRFDWVSRSTGIETVEAARGERKTRNEEGRLIAGPQDPIDPGAAAGNSGAKTARKGECNETESTI
mgnify:CR=1 FL=1